MLHLEALELGEEFVLILRLDTDSRILHGSRQDDISFVLLLPFQRELHEALICVFHGIVEDVRIDLADADFIAHQGIGDRRIHFDREAEVFVLCLEKDHVVQVIEHGAQLIRRHHEVKFSRFDLTEIEDVVHDRKEVISRALYVLRIHADIRQCIARALHIISRKIHAALLLADDHLIHAENCVDRCSDLMGHIRQKVTLGLAGALGSYFFFQKFFLLGNKRTDHQQQKERRHKLCKYQDHDVSDDGISGLLGELSVEPVCGEVCNDDTGDVSL